MLKNRFLFTHSTGMGEHLFCVGKWSVGDHKIGDWSLKPGGLSTEKSSEMGS